MCPIDDQMLDAINLTIEDEDTVLFFEIESVLMDILRQLEADVCVGEILRDDLAYSTLLSVSATRALVAPLKRPLAVIYE